MSAKGAPIRSRPKLLLVGAGPTEVGRQELNGPDLHGAVLPHMLDILLAPAMGRLFSNGERGYEIPRVAHFDRDFQIIPPGRRTNQLRNRDAEKIRRALFLADTLGLDGVVAVIDRESKQQPDRAERMRRGRTAYRRRAVDSGPACAVGAACRCIETWLLADRQARQDVFDAEARNPFSGDPEERPDADTLKAYIKHHCDQRNLDRAATYEDLAKSARPEELKRRCPTSYQPFVDEVAAEITPLFRQ